MCEILDAKIQEKEFVNNSDTSGLLDNPALDKKIETLAKKEELKEYQDKTVKLQSLVSSYFHSKSHFEDAGTQSYLAVQTVFKYFKKS